MNDTDLAAGVRRIPVAAHRDARGCLHAFDRDTLPFAPVRTFVISGVPPHATRGGHVVSCEEFLWVATGSCRLTVSEAERVSSFLLDSPDEGILLPAGVEMVLTDFAPQTLLVVMASTAFAETDDVRGFGAHG